jgi:hypothetical protein
MRLVKSPTTGLVAAHRKAEITVLIINRSEEGISAVSGHGGQCWVAGRSNQLMKDVLGQKT